MTRLKELLDASAALHQHLCPRQVLGVRLGMLAGQLFELDLPQTDKRLLAIVETDGCAADGIAVAAGCWVGRRTLRVEDYGKVAATFADTETGRTLRIAPRAGVRSLAERYAPEAQGRWEAQLLGYQRIPDHELFAWQPVELATPITEIVSRAGLRTVCARCGEEIINQREVLSGGQTLCRACAGAAYYVPAGATDRVLARVR